MDINKIFIIGRLVRDSEIKATPTGTPVLEFTVANNKKIQRDNEWVEESYFFDCSLFGKKAESLSKYLKKGKQVAIDGELKQSKWKTPDGENRSRISIYVNLVQMLGGNKQSSFVGEEFDSEGIPF